MEQLYKQVVKMPMEIDFGRALSLVANAVEHQARILAGRYGRYNEADELREAMKKIKNIALHKPFAPLN
ncbi:hypothetical protein HY448_01670 [Candidatus Pacearchaeota archaeon]|nr:hypothetical protein [Candidatus Pacearchaeota archaeon]